MHKRGLFPNQVHRGPLSYFLDRSLPAIGLAPRDGELIVSSRATPELIERGLNLAEVMSHAAGKCGGMGGGHAIAAGASVMPARATQFVGWVRM